jgi:type II restriction enzyme
MKFSEVFQQRIGCKGSDEVFSYLMNTLKPTVSGWDYFVNWAKVFGNVSEIEMDLNMLNYLIGKEDIEGEFSKLLVKYPSIARLVPILIACRDRQFDILYKKDGGIAYEHYDFAKGGMSVDDVVRFARESGFLLLLKEKRLKNVVDYVVGVEVGLDSNGRKNRGGTAMEGVVEGYVAGVCKTHGFHYIAQATAGQVQKQWGIKVKVDKSERRIDFAINSGKSLFLVETNFYTGGGSKLKATAGEYKDISDFFKADGHQFVWITDGEGWRTTQRPLRETFDRIDYLLNLDMVDKGLLEDIVMGK